MAPRHAFKVLCPEPLASSILGTKGSSKDRIQEETGCRLVMSNRDEFYPQTRLRLVVIHGDQQDAVLKAVDRILKLLAECADTERGSPGGRTAIQGEADFLGKEPNELVMRLAVPVKVGSAIIGPKGAHVQQLKEECSAKVIIDNEHRSGHQLCRVAAQYEGLRMVASHISGRLAEELQTRPVEFEAWANVRSFAWEESHGKGHQRGRSRSRERGGGSAFRGMGIGVLDEALGQLGPALDFEYEITCQLPPEKVSAMIGPGGQIVRNVRQSTGTAIHFDEVHPGAREQTMRLKGPLVGVYRAHVMMMRRYHEHEAEAQLPSKGGAKASGKGGLGPKGDSFSKGSPGKGKETWPVVPPRSKGYDKGFATPPAPSHDKGFGKSPSYDKGGPKGPYGKGDLGSKGAPNGKGKSKDTGRGRDFGGGASASDGASREQLEGMLANLERQLNEVKGQLSRS